MGSLGSRERLQSNFASEFGDKVALCCIQASKSGILILFYSTVTRGLFQRKMEMQCNYTVTHRSPQTIMPSATLTTTTKTLGLHYSQIKLLNSSIRPFKMHIFGQVLISFQQVEEAPALINNLIYSETLLQSLVIAACTHHWRSELGVQLQKIFYINQTTIREPQWPGLEGTLKLISFHTNKKFHYPR